MPDDLLRFVGGPSPYSTAWLWIALALTVAVILWVVGVFVWTLPAARLRSIPVIRTVHGKLLRRKFSRVVRSIDGRYRSGALSAPQAGSQMSRALRSFLYQATGTRAQFMHLDEIKASDLAEAAPLIAALNDLQFNTASEQEPSTMGAAAEELIRAWA